MVSKGDKTAAAAARLFQIHPAIGFATVGLGLRQIACKVLRQIIGIGKATLRIARNSS